ncbi:MAG: hypothetical protein ACOCTP_02780 [Roseicyclus sp.]
MTGAVPPLPAQGNTTVVAGTVASSRGVGNMRLIALPSFDVPPVFAMLMVLATMGNGFF